MSRRNKKHKSKLPKLTKEQQEKISDQLLDSMEAIELGAKFSNGFIDKHTEKMADELEEPFKSIMKDKTSRDLLIGSLLKSFGITDVTIIKDEKSSPK